MSSLTPRTMCPRAAAVAARLATRLPHLLSPAMKDFTITDTAYVPPNFRTMHKLSGESWFLTLNVLFETELPGLEKYNK